MCVVAAETHCTCLDLFVQLNCSITACNCCMLSQLIVLENTSWQLILEQHFKEVVSKVLPSEFLESSVRSLVGLLFSRYNLASKHHSIMPKYTQFPKTHSLNFKQSPAHCLASWSPVLVGCRLTKRHGALIAGSGRRRACIKTSLRRQWATPASAAQQANKVMRGPRLSKSDG